MINQLSSYQLEGANFLVKNRFALLADDMGVGKTAQAIAAADAVNAKRILIVCPAVARPNWKREFEMWSREKRDFKVCKDRGDFPGSLSIVSYDYAASFSDRLRKIIWDLVICDESHFVKEPEAKRTKAIFGKDGVIRNTHRMWCLSGTPAPNHAAEMWPMLYTFGTTPLSYDHYVEKFCHSRTVVYGGKHRKQITGNKKAAIPELRELLSKVMLRRTKEQVLKDLPPISFEEFTIEASYVPTSPEDEAKITVERAVVENHLASLSNIADSVATLRKQLGLQKVRGVAELISSELENKAYEKIILFCIHRDVVSGLKELLAKFNPVVVNGDVKADDRQLAIDRFQNDDRYKVFIANITSAGTAITLTAAHEVGMVERSWNQAENAQAICRAYRRGQKMPVRVRDFTTEDSLDQRISSTLRRKTQDFIMTFKGEENGTHN